ncbi:MAG: hypothetical protein AAF830_05085, partial [Pseudomonadota bacterium]
MADFSHATRRVARLQERSVGLLNAMRAQLLGEHEEKTLPLRFSIRQASKMVGKSDMTIRRAEESGALPAPEKRESG